MINKRRILKKNYENINKFYKKAQVKNSKDEIITVKYLDSKTMIKKRLEREMDKNKNLKICLTCKDTKDINNDFYKTKGYSMSICKYCYRKKNNEYYKINYKPKFIKTKLDNISDETFKAVYNDLQKIGYKLHQVYHIHEKNLGNITYPNFKNYYKKGYFNQDHHVPRTKKNFKTYNYCLKI